MNLITIELCAEDRARIDKVIELLGGLRLPDCSACVAGVASYLEKAATVLDSHPVSEPFPAATVVKEEPAKKNADLEAMLKKAISPEPAKPTVTLEQIQKKATQIAAGSAEKKAKLRAIVNQYAKKVTDLPESSWPTVWDELCKLESEA